MFANILVAAGVVWILLSVLSYMQFLILRGIYNVLSEKGRIVTSQDLGMFRTKYRLFAAVSKEGIVIEAKVLKVVRFVTPPKLLEFPAAAGLDLNNFDSAALDVEPRLRLAAENLKHSWNKLKVVVNRDIPSVAPLRGKDAQAPVQPDQPAGDASPVISGNKWLALAEGEIRGLLTDDKLKINKAPLKMVLDTLLASDYELGFSTDEVIADKASQLRAAVRAEIVDVPKVDGLVETMFRLVAQREREARFRRQNNS